MSFATATESPVAVSAEFSEEESEAPSRVRQTMRPSMIPSIVPSIHPRPARRRPASKTARVRSKNLATPKAAVALRAPRQTVLTVKSRKAQKMRMSDALAAELLTRYSSLVRQIAGGFQRRLPRSVLREDLVAAGMSGLWDAIRRHADRPGESFDWYVRVRIRGAILDELRAQDWLPRRARAAAAEANEAGDMSVTAPSVVRFDDVSEWEQNRSLTAPESNSEAAVEAKFVRENLARAVQQLPERERHIVSAHYFQGVKFKDLGAELGVSEPRISQLHSRAMQRLKGLMHEAA
ncbi:MAG TPA: sigma-70 family RNA polymerase sigma factor [Polyangiaceae bacterium]|nr:sigma-70 family RNA polymerase sigma factor [Polyangiaceae bacterium]